MVSNYVDVTGTTIHAGTPYATTPQEYINLLSWAGLDKTLAYALLTPAEQQKIQAIINTERDNAQNASSKKGC
jgi:hypothetical protein